MPQYKIADTFLQRIYNGDEQKVVTHKQANLILRILCAVQEGAMDIEGLVGFIEGHPALKAMLATSQDTRFVLRWHLRRLISVGAVVEA